MTPPEAFAPEAFAPEAFAPEAFAYVQKLQNARADLAFAQELIAGGPCQLPFWGAVPRHSRQAQRSTDFVGTADRFELRDSAQIPPSPNRHKCTCSTDGKADTSLEENAFLFGDSGSEKAGSTYLRTPSDT